MIQFVTTNEGKYREVSRRLGEVDIECRMLSLDYLEIQCDSLEDVVVSSMNWLQERIEGDFLMDDSGLFIPYLCGFPGVYSSYVYRTIGSEGILKILEGIEDRSADFKCCFGLHWRGENKLFTGVVRGSITEQTRGEGGFGFDPIFLPSGSSRTFAEMSVEEKNRYSHRGKALEKLLAFLKKHSNPEPE